MITLYAFGPQFGLPDSSPFVTKADVLLKMAKLPFEINLKGFRKAPKGKLPYIKDDGELIADSTFIRRHLESKHKIDFDRGLSAEQKAIAWAFEKLAEDHLYWTIVDARWTIDAERIACPVRIVWGREDRLLPWPHAAAGYRRRLPHADWIELDGAGHCPPLDVPLETAQLILGS